MRSAVCGSLVDDSGTVYIGGYRHSSPGDTIKPTVHRLADDGHVTASFYPLDPRSESLNLKAIAGVSLALGPAGTLYAAQVTGNEAVQFKADGEPVATIGGPSAVYRAPTVLPVLPSGTQPARISAFLSQWTQLVTVIPGPDGYVMIVYAVHSPVKYAANIYQNGSLVAEGIGTDCRPVAWLADGRVLVRDTRGRGLAVHAYKWNGSRSSGH